MNDKRYKKEVEIFGEKIEVEYFNLGLDYNMNLWDKIVAFPYTIKRKIKEFYRETCYGLQRMFKGYDAVDTFETYAKFIDRYSKILTEYKKNMHGYPGMMTEEEWNKIIDDMLLHLYWMDESNVERELEKDVPKNWCLCWNATQEIMDKHKDEFFKLFSKYFYNLWD